MLRCLVTPSGRLALCRVGSCVVTHGKSEGVASWRHVLQLNLSRPFTRTRDIDSEASGCSTKSVLKRGRSKAVHDLAYLILDRHAKSSSIKLQTPHDIKAHYRALKAKGLLHELSANELSAIIRLFASLSMLPELRSQSSVSEDTSTGAFAFHPLASDLDKHQASGTRSHWAFVLSVANDKVSRGFTHGNSDNYWLMRAALEDAKRILSQDPEGGDIKPCLHRAKKHYTLLKPPKSEWSVHQVYLTALLDYGGRSFADEIVARLGNLLCWRNGLPPSLRGIFWRVLTLPGANVSLTTKSRFLHVLRNRLSKVQDVLPRSSYPSRETESRLPEEITQRNAYDALAIRDYFVDVIFSFSPGNNLTLRCLRDVYPWALFECRAALCAFNDGTFATSEEEDRAAWSNLVLLSLSIAAGRKALESGSAADVIPEPGLDGGVHSQAQVLGWTIICSLAALSSELHMRSHSRKHADPSFAEGIQEVSRTLWFLWRKEEAWRAGAVTRSMPLICCATTTFMALASASGDSRLAIALVRHITDAIIYPAQLGGEILDRSMLQECAVHFAILTATTGVGGPPQHSWDGILGALRYAQLIPDGESRLAIKWSNSIASATLVDLAQVDSMLAHELSQSTAEYDLAIGDDAILSIGKALASSGHLELALTYLKDGQISADTASLILDSLLINTLRYCEDDLRTDRVRVLLNVFTDTSIRPTNNRALEAFIQACMNAGYLKESIRVVEIICESSPSLLSSRFLSRMVTAIASHRHYKILGKMLKNAWCNMPGRRTSFFRNSRLRYTERVLDRFPQSSSREIARTLPFSICIWPFLRHHIPFHPRLAQLDKKIISLKLSNRLQKSGNLNERNIERAVHLLVSAGRITAAMKLLDKHAPTISTKAGNIILSASLRPKASHRQRRQVHHASARLAQLVEKRGFVPDRVTVNLLVKALLRWDSITPKSTLRALFDRLTMNGYPIPDGFLNRMNNPDPVRLPGAHKPSSNVVSHTVFGTDISDSPRDSLPINLKAFPKRISFTRHTRPLYKMFVKAFKARGDEYGARRVREALRGVGEIVAQENIKRDEARRLGRINTGRMPRRNGNIDISEEYGSL